MKVSFMMSAVALAAVGCARPVTVTAAQRSAAAAAIAVVVDSMNAAWRRADFTAADRPLLDDAVVTFNDSRESGAAARADDASPTTAFVGQYIAPYKVRYDVPSPDVAVTSWENDFARVGADHARQPMQTALMTIVWKRTDAGWRILSYHESTRPKERAPSETSLVSYAGSYSTTGQPDAKFTVAARALNIEFGDAKPAVLTAFTDPDFGMDGVRITFIRARDGTVQGVLLARPDGTSRYAWRVSASSSGTGGPSGGR